MIIIAVIRTTGIPIRKNNVDLVWELFWAEAEASIAVIMVSITAFRSLLGIKALKAREEGTILVGLIPSEKARQISHKVIPKKIQVIRAPIHSKCNLGRDAQIYSRNRVWDEDLRATNYGPHKIKVTRQFLTESEIPNGPASAANFV